MAAGSSVQAKEVSCMILTLTLASILAKLRNVSLAWGDPHDAAP
jgi:hypothetical protein